MGIRDLFKKKSKTALLKELEEEELNLKIQETKNKKRQQLIKLKEKISKTKRKSSSLKNPGLKKAGKVAKSLAIGFGERLAAGYEMQERQFTQQKIKSKSSKKKPKKRMGYENPFDLGF